MPQDPLQALRAATRPPPAVAGKPRLLIAGATGALGNEVLRRLAGSSAFAHTQVLAREPITAGMRGVRATLVPSDAPAQWPPAAADTAVMLFDPPRMFYQRERALWTPTPALCCRLHAGCARAACARWPSCCRTRLGGCPRPLSTAWPRSTSRRSRRWASSAC